MKNIILNTDSYKLSHWPQYPKGTTGVFSYAEARGGAYDETVVFNIQPYIKELAKGVTMADIDEAEKIVLAHGEPFNREGWEYIVNELGGKLPVRIKAVPEGNVVPISNALVTIENTDPNCYWLTSYLETGLLRAIWYGSTVATISWNIKQLIMKYLNETGTPEDIYFKLHDFGARGVSSFESSEIGGAAHLVNFMGTDTVSALQFIMRNYNTDEVAGFSIPASEHSTMMYGGRENETKAYRNMLEVYGPNGIFACVSDSYDIYNAVENIWGGELRQEVIDSGATVVIRPDSGDPVAVNRRLLDILDDKFGSDVNDKGFKVLKHVRLIQGDGINYSTIDAILSMAVSKGFSADNFAFGMGGALLQGMDRDTQQWAMKCSAMEIDGEWINVSKDPVTDQGKKSKPGRLALVKKNDTYFTVNESTDLSNILETVFENGEVVKEYTFAEVRANSEK